MGGALLCLPATTRAATPSLEAVLAAAARAESGAIEASATARQRVYEADMAWKKLWPTLTAKGVYTENQYESKVTFPASGGGGGATVTITPQHQLDAFLTLDVPLIDVGAWRRAKAADLTADGARARAESSSLEAQKTAARQYYQLLGARALRASARRSVDAAIESLKVTENKATVGVASKVDLDRARANVEAQRRALAEAEQLCATSRRALATLTALDIADEDGAALEDDLHEEPRLEAWGGGESVAAVRAASIDARAADANLDAAWATLYPTLSAQASERFTNATGFANVNAYYTLSATLQWKLDFSALPGIHAAEAERDAAAARAKKASDAARDEIHDAWHQVRAQIGKARAARAQHESDQSAAQLAKDRYEKGTGTQLEVITADRDAFASDVARIQADADLAYARALLRLASGRSRTPSGTPEPAAAARADPERLARLLSLPALPTLSSRGVR
jgi:outer membrane protein TolC